MPFVFSYCFIFYKNCTSFTNLIQMIFNAFFKDFPLDCQKYMYHQKPEHLLLDNQSNVSFSDVIGISLWPLGKKTLISIIIQFHFTMPHSLYGLRLYKISNEIYFSIMTLWKYIYKTSYKSNKSIRYLRCELSLLSFFLIMIY